MMIKKANGKHLERLQLLHKMTPEQLVARVQLMGFKFSYRQYKQMIADGYVPRANGDEIIKALATVLNVKADSLLEKPDEAA